MTVRSFARFPAVLAALGLTVVVWLATGVFAQAPASLTLLARDTRRTIPLAVVNDQEMVALDELATLFQLSVREEAGAVTVTSRGRTIVLNPEQTIASVAGRMISLPARPVRQGGRLLVPVDFITRAVAPIVESRIELRRASRLLIVGDLKVPRLTMVSEVLPNSYRLTIDATPPATSTISRDGDHLTVKFDADAVDVTIPATPPQPFVQNIRRLDPVTLALDLGPRFSSYRSSAQPVDASARLSIELLPPPMEVPAPGSPSAPAGAPAPVITATPPIDLPTFGQPTIPIRTVAIDPGHGGADEGARGAGGLTEKAVTLAIARRTKAALEARLGLRVLLTREDDRELAIDARTAVANNNKADLFISLHANASFRPETTGAAVLVAQFANEGLARQTLVPHRVPVFGGGLRDIEIVPWHEAQIRYVDQSAVFADALQQQLQPRIPMHARAADRVPLRVLASANMPAVLVEVGFLSNSEQEARLGSGEFQGAIATAVVDAVVAFREYLSRAPQGER